jgi:hypothetical protein
VSSDRSSHGPNSSLYLDLDHTVVIAGEAIGLLERRTTIVAEVDQTMVSIKAFSAARR